MPINEKHHGELRKTGVIPAKAGLQFLFFPMARKSWMTQTFVCQKRPAFAGMTRKDRFFEVPHC
jgi:hypothetical protein